MDFYAALPKHVVMLLPALEGGMSTMCKVDVEYEWLPSKCDHCELLGHDNATCPTQKRDTRKRQPPVQVYIQKPFVAEKCDTIQTQVAKEPCKQQVTSAEAKGKAIVVCNLVEVLQDLETDDAQNSWVPKACSPLQSCP